MESWTCTAPPLITFLGVMEGISCLSPRALLSKTPTSKAKQRFFFIHIPTMDDDLAGLVRDNRLEVVSFCGNNVVHIFDDPNRPPNSTQCTQHWKFKKNIGQGGQARVILQEMSSDSGGSTLRAVKVIERQHGDKRFIPELKAIMKFSHPKVSIPSYTYKHRHTEVLLVLQVLCQVARVV